MAVKARKMSRKPGRQAPKLTPKQARFVEEYMVDLNATQAAIRASYSAKNADKIGPELLGKTRVAQAVAEAIRARSERTEITQDMVLQELALIGFADMGDYVTISDNGNILLDLTGLPEGATKVIHEVTQDEYKEGRGDEARDVKKTKLKLYDKRSALVDIGKHLGMFVDRSEVGKPGDFEKLSDEELDREIATLTNGKDPACRGANGAGQANGSQKS